MEVAIKNQGRNEMTMGPIKVRTSSRKHAEHFRSKKYPFDAALLSVTEDSEQLRRNVSRLIEQGEEIANETIFQTLLSDANRELDRKSTRLNSSHQIISYAVFCLKKKKKDKCE